MAKFRKKPVVIDAMRWDGAAMSIPVPDWFLKPWSENIIDRNQEDRSQLLIKTLEGTMTANAGDWIICGVNGEIYPCKPDIFEKTYEPVE